ncbi:MAG: DUF790 family protein [Acaryochloridaceae cyanobacterium RL_2_7]|nr:DUF790 family protein [Acaryochloridaceae cyanobacterium RL_2_7]
MLPSDLLISRYQGNRLVPTHIALNAENLDLAQTLIDCFESFKGKTQGELQAQLQEIEGDRTDYRLKRGLAHLLQQSFSTFETVSPLEPAELRALVFDTSSQQCPSPQQTVKTFETVAIQLSETLGIDVSSEAVKQGLYADRKDNQILTEFTPPTSEALIHRYNLSQVQGLFYRASQVIIQAYRNDPGEYKLLFRYIKLFRLMAYIEGEADLGFTLTLDGPTSLFQASTRYGLDLAKMIPALLNVSQWSLKADLNIKDQFSKELKTMTYELSSDNNLVSHYKKGKPFDSMIEESFFNSWQKAKTDWHLEREVELIPIPGSVMIPDFRLVHPDGKVLLLEIIGYWRPEYLQKKFAQIRKANRNDILLAVSSRLNLEKAGIKEEEIQSPIIWFKQKLTAKLVLQQIEDNS